jgi:hypothetical protein
MSRGLRAGAAAVAITPPLGLPMVGFVRQWQLSEGYGRLPLETTALVLDSDDARLVLCGVDTAGIQAPRADALRERVAEACGTDPASVLLSWNHTHLAPPSGAVPAWLALDDPSPALARAIAAYGDCLDEWIVGAAAAAARRLEPATAAWGVGHADVLVNRRERTADGRTILGWNPALPVDASVTALAVRRPDGSAVATAVNVGCHPVAAGWDCLFYSADYPGAVRQAVRAWTGGECVFLQGAAGNVLPRFGFQADEDEAERMGRRIALEALHAVADRPGARTRVERVDSGSVTPISLYRRHDEPVPVQLAAAEERVAFPLQPLPTADEIAAERERHAQAVEQARAAGADRAGLATLLYSLRWAEATEAEIATGSPRTGADGPIAALRVGDGVLVTGPGEVFTEIGLAVKERSPAEVTGYAGYANGLLTYFAIASEYPFGGYEPGYGNRSFGLPAQVTPEADRLLVETGVRLAERLFPERPPWPAERGWLASGEPVPPTEPDLLAHPDLRSP